MRKMLRKITTMVTAAALAMTLTPASALAHEQTTASVQLGSSTANGVSVGDDVVQDEGASEDIPALYATARANQMSVDAPVRVTFEGAGNAAYDVNNKAAWGTPTANVTFTNWHSKNVYIKNVAVKQDASANVGKVFSGTVGSAANPFLTLQNASANGTETATLSTLAPNTSSSNNMQFGTNAAAAEQEKVAKRFKIAKNASGSGTSATFTLKLNPASATLRSASDLQSANFLNGNATDFAKIAWTFAVQKVSDPSDGEGTASTATDGFYLKVAGNPVTPALQQYKGKVYSLAQVRTHSKELGSGEADTDSDLYKFYYALVTSMAPEGDYECVVKYDNKDWRLRIIGLNQDYAASAIGSGDYQYAAGDRVGLTFQFVNLIDKDSLSSGSDNSGGWGGGNASRVRNRLSKGGTYYNSLAIHDSVVSVTKFYSPLYSNTGSVQPILQDLFLPSYHELMGGKSTGWSYPTYTWIKNEGAGNHTSMINTHDAQYLFYQNKGIIGNNTNYRWLTKFEENTTTTAYVIAANGDGNSATAGTGWWERSVHPGNSGNFLRVDAGGRPNGESLPNAKRGICPCFCL